MWVGRIADLPFYLLQRGIGLQRLELCELKGGERCAYANGKVMATHASDLRDGYFDSLVTRRVRAHRGDTGEGLARCVEMKWHYSSRLADGG